jgi:hypothetical protein
MMYGDNKKKKERMPKMGGGRSVYNKGGYASVQQMEQSCGSKTVKQQVK